MKIINAIWEKRNLGVNTIELEFERSDLLLQSDLLIKNIDDAIKVCNAEYIVAKIPSGYNSILNMLQECEFKFIENQIEIKYIIKDVKKILDNVRHLFGNAIVNRINNIDDLERIKAEVRKGVFDTDRIANDKHFSIELANNRYANWIEDEYNRGTSVYTVDYEGEEIGFFLTRYMNTKTHFGILGGLYPEYKSKGLSMYWDFAGIEESIKNNAKILNGSVSSNNLEVLKLHQFFGAKVDNIKSILIKHI
jgi:hypothetical protein